MHLSLHENRACRARPPRNRRSLPGQKQHHALVAHPWERSTLSRQHVVHSLRDNSEPRERTTTPCDIPGSVGRVVHKIARSFTSRDDARSFPRHWKFRRRRAALWREKIYWV